MKRASHLLLACLLLTLFSSGCALIQRDRCYLHQYRYEAMKDLFLQTGSYQRVAQAMDDEGWARCEINTFRQSLRKDLALEGPDYDMLFTELEPDSENLDFRPGYVPYPTADQ